MRLTIVDTLLGAEPDDRIHHYKVLNNTSSVFQIIALYLLSVYVILPKFMKNRKAYDLKYVIYAFNTFQVIINTWVVSEILKGGWNINYVYCVNVDRSTSPEALRTVRALYVLVMVKIFDMLETGIFILRKKNNQVSFLHVFHHIITLFICWTMTRYAPGGSHVNSFFLNCMIHVIMYSYYQLAALGFKNLTKWKKIITKLQLIQFGFIISSTTFIAFNPRCDLDLKWQSCILCYVMNPAMVMLFWNFYKKEYEVDKRK